MRLGASALTLVQGRVWGLGFRVRGGGRVCLWGCLQVGGVGAGGGVGVGDLVGDLAWVRVSSGGCNTWKNPVGRCRAARKGMQTLSRV